jgi:DNA gyrase/topoisomerase IV subunit A
MEEFTVQYRGGKGVKCYKITEKTGDLIGVKAVNEENEELMLSVNKKFGVQFYYTFSKNFYKKIKSKKLPTKFNFSGEKFLNSIQVL